jgi:hypothetical protein
MQWTSLWSRLEFKLKKEHTLCQLMMGFSSVNNFFKCGTQIPWATPESTPSNSLKQRDLLDDRPWRGKAEGPIYQPDMFPSIMLSFWFDRQHQLLASLSFWSSTPFPANPSHYYYSAWYRRLKFSWLTSLSFKSFDCNTVHRSASPLLAGIVVSSVA